jgi:cyclophilin family peptidyl-prolyl cis-trans isomerase
MNQTTWVVGGGIILVAIAGLLYVSSGSGEQTKKDPTIITPETITIDNKPVATSTPDAMEIEKSTESAILHTDKGDITVTFYPKDAPKTVENFLTLAKSGFYDGVKFHRVIKGFMIQTGDPFTKDDTKIALWGKGSSPTKFADEIAPGSSLYARGYKHGILAMANSGPNTNGSQFFIMAADYPLQPNYTIFGEVTEGLPVVDAIDAVETDGPERVGGHDRPLVPIVIKSVEVK